MLNVTDSVINHSNICGFKMEYITHSNITKLNKNQIFGHMLLFTSDSFFVVSKLNNSLFYFRFMTASERNPFTGNISTF